MRFEGVVSLVTDITEQREIEEQLRYNEARLTTLFEVSSDIMAILEPDGHWHASPAGTRILGYPIGWDPEGGILSLVHPDDIELAGQALEEVLNGHAGQARADPGPPPPHRRPLPLVRLHRREPDRQPDGARA